LWSILDKFKAAAIKERKIDKVNHRASVKVGAAAPIWHTTISSKPIRCQNGKILKIVNEYPDCLCAIEALADG
jgi:hypothetical protein